MGILPSEGVWWDEDDSPSSAAIGCLNCGHNRLSGNRVSTGFWQRGAFVVIRDIPALVCPVCHEEYLSDQTARSLARMRRDGLSPDKAAKRIEVPVFDYRAAPMREES